MRVVLITRNRFLSLSTRLLREELLQRPHGLCLLQPSMQSLSEIEVDRVVVDYRYVTVVPGEVFFCAQILDFLQYFFIYESYAPNFVTNVKS